MFILQCNNPACRFRTTSLLRPTLETCPLCGSNVSIQEKTQPPFIASHPSFNAPSQLIVLLDNIRSVLNVGSIFRTSDAVGVSKIYLCGITPTPDNPKLAKTGLGAECSVPWEYSPNSVDVADRFKCKGFELFP